MRSKKDRSEKRREVMKIVEKAQAAANMTEKEALELAVKETRAARAERATRR